MKNKNLTHEINGDIIKISYKLDLGDELTDNVKNNYDNIDFSIEVDTNKKEIKHFEFDLSKYYGSMLKSDSNNSVELTSKITTYCIEGKILNNKLERKDTSSVQYKEYNDETKYEFIDDFVNHAIPTRDIY